MGQYDALIYTGAALVAGYFIITNPDIISGLFPTPQPEPEPGGEFGSGGGGGDSSSDEGDSGSGGKSSDSSSKGSYDCAKACRNCWCKSYNDKCGSSGCSKCKGGNRILSKCGAGVDTSSSSKDTNKSSGSFGSGGSSSSSNDSTSIIKPAPATSCLTCRGGKCKGLTGATCTACCNAGSNLAYVYRSYPYGQLNLSNAY